MADALTLYLFLMALSLTTAPSSVNLAKNPIWVKFTSSGHGSLDNYRVVLRVLLEETYESGTYTEQVEVESIPDSTGKTIFDISSVLQSAMERVMELQVPDLDNPAPYLADTLRRFKIEYAEKYGTPQEEQPATTSSAYKVLYGGVEAQFFAGFYFFINLDDENALLTYYPSGKAIASQQHEFITYIEHTSVASPHCFIRVVQYDDTGVEIGTSDHYRLASDYIAPMFPIKYQAVVFPVGIAALLISTECAKYTATVFVVDSISGPGGNVESGSETAASQSYTFYIDRTVKSTSTLIWLNGFRAPHILRCTGRLRTSLSVERLISEVVPTQGYDPHLTGRSQYRRNFSNPLQYRTGSLKPLEKTALQEMLIENLVFEHAADGNYYRLLLTETSYPITETETSPNYLEFNAVRSLAPQNFQLIPVTAEPILASFLVLEDDSGYFELEASTDLIILE